MHVILQSSATAHFSNGHGDSGCFYLLSMINETLYRTLQILLLSLLSYMLLRSLLHRPPLPTARLVQMSAHLTNGALNGSSNGSDNSTFRGVSLQDLPKFNTFTSKLPPDPEYKTPSASHNAPREDLGPRMVKGALYTFVRPEETSELELLGVSPAAIHDIGLRPGEENKTEFKALVAGNKIYWDPSTEEGIYPGHSAMAAINSVPGLANWVMAAPFRFSNPRTHLPRPATRSNSKVPVKHPTRASPTARPCSDPVSASSSSRKLLMLFTSLPHALSPSLSQPTPASVVNG